MAERHDKEFDEFLAIRKPGAHLEEEVVADDFVIQLRVDLKNYHKFPRVDDNVTYPKTNLDIRQELDTDSGAELPDYSGPYKAELRFTDFSKEALASKFLPWSEAYMQLCVDGWAREVAKRYGAETMAEVEWAAWTGQVVPELERMKNEFLPAGTVYEDPNSHVPENERVRMRVVYTGLFTPDSSTVKLSKPEIVTWLLGSHEYLLQCIEAWATQITLRYGLDVMFDIQWTLWGRLRAAGGTDRGRWSDHSNSLNQLRTASRPALIPGLLPPFLLCLRPVATPRALSRRSGLRPLILRAKERP
jgi:hypothetical protein